MKKPLRQIAILAWAVVSLSACGGGSSSDAAIGSEPVVAQLPTISLADSQGLYFGTINGGGSNLTVVCVVS